MGWLLVLAVVAVGLHRLTRDPLEDVSRIEIMRRLWAAPVIRERE